MRRSEDGALTTIRARVDWTRLAVARDGAILGTAEYGGVTRIPAGGGTPRPVFYDDVSEDVVDDFDGRLARSFPDTELGAIAPLADGGLLAVSGLDDPRLRYVAPAAPARTAVALELRAGRVGAGSYRAAYRVTRPATLRLSVLGPDGRRLAAVTREVAAGAGTLVVRGRFPFAPSRVRLIATTADGARAADQLRLRLGDVVPVRDARRLLVPARVDIGGGCSNCEVVLVPVRAEGCRRLDARRVACRYSHRVAPSRRTCVIAAVRRTRDGTLERRRYDCPRRGPRIPATGDGSDWEDVRADVT